MRAAGAGRSGGRSSAAGEARGAVVDRAGSWTGVSVRIVLYLVLWTVSTRSCGLYLVGLVDCACVHCHEWVGGAFDCHDSTFRVSVTDGTVQ